MSARVRISQHADPDNRWSRFERDSKLPRNAFAADRGDHIVLLMCVLIALLFLLGWIS